MIAQPPVPDQRICAALFFRGVLPAFEDFVKFDPVARKRAGGMRGGVVFEDDDGNRAALSFEGAGGVRWSEVERDRAQVRIWLGRRGKVVRLVRGGFAVPGVRRGWSRPGTLVRLVLLFLRFQRLLRPRAGDLEDDAFRLTHVRLALAVALFSLAEIAREDVWGRRILEDCPEGAVRFSVAGSDLQAVVVKDEHGLRPLRGRGGCVPRAEVVFASSKVAMEILTRKRDAHGALAMGDIRVDGLIPLADSVNHVLDRVALYLPNG